jgi:hypothetical protein
VATGQHRTQGAILVSDPDLGNTETRTFTCIHCNAVVPVPFGSETILCRMCFAPICLACAKLNTCTPFEKKLDQMEARDRLRRAVETG